MIPVCSRPQCVGVDQGNAGHHVVTHGTGNYGVLDGGAGWVSMKAETEDLRADSANECHEEEEEEEEEDEDEEERRFLVKRQDDNHNEEGPSGKGGEDDSGSEEGGEEGRVALRGSGYKGCKRPFKKQRSLGVFFEMKSLSKIEEESR